MLRSLLLLLSLSTSASGQWIAQESHTKASLRGVHSLGGGIAWASGTGGTVLRTTDGGKSWILCAAPSGAEKLDFRGIQALNRDAAVIMSSGTGSLSRIYRTIDACRSWQLVYSNPDPEGFWDAIQFDGSFGALIGDPVDGHFPVFTTQDAGKNWARFTKFAISALEGKQSLFAASNSSMLLDRANSRIYFITGGGTNSFISLDMDFDDAAACLKCVGVTYVQPDMAVGAAAGGFSLGARRDGQDLVLVAVGGDYKAPEQTKGTAARYREGRETLSRWEPAENPPHGYRSAVAYLPGAKTWIAVGPNGTDFSKDDGKTWQSGKKMDGEVEDKQWNALSLPFVVGAGGRIAMLRTDLQ